MVRRRSQGGGRARIAVAVGAVALATALAPAVRAAAVALPPLPTPPPVPAPAPLARPPAVVPGIPASPCTFRPLQPGEERMVSLLRAAGWGSAPGGAYGAHAHDAVDPWAPCHVFRSQDSTVARSDDGGATFSKVLIGSSQGPQPAMTAGPLTFTAPGQLYVEDSSGPDGVFFSPDQGQHWAQRNGGLVTAGDALGSPLGLLPTDTTIRALRFAFSDAHTGYLIAAAGGTTVLYGTVDGGQHWSVRAQPGHALTDVAVDPADAAHVYASGDSSTNAVGPGVSYVEESRDGGASWSLIAGPGSASPTRVLAVRTGTSPALELFGYALDNDGLPRWFSSDDDGVTWSVTPVPQTDPQSVTDLAADPAHPGHMLWVAAALPGAPRGLFLASTTNAFHSVGPASSAPLAAPGTVTQLTLQPDRAGDFFVEIGQDGSSGWSDELMAVSMAAVHRIPYPSEPPAQPSAPSSSYLRECRLAAPPGGGTLPPIPGGLLGLGLSNSSSSGSIAFDGHYLDYTNDSADPGVIDRVDPRNCTRAAPLYPKLPLDSTGSAQVLDALTYDARYVFGNGDVGAILARGSSDSRLADGVVPIYAVDPIGDVAELALGVGSDRRDPTVLTYDVFTNRLWAYDPTPNANGGQGQPVPLAFPRTKGGLGIPGSTCMDSWSSASSGPIASTWEVGSEGILYIHSEDDATVFRVDSRTCTTLGQFSHSAFSEAGDENDQMACDAVTFGAGSDYAQATSAPTSALWIRDASMNVAYAYPIIDGYCPFPTVLALDRPLTTPVGSVVSLCATLTDASADRLPLARQPLTFTLDGRAAGGSTTDGSGHACVAATAPGPPGPHGVEARFAGNHAYLGASDRTVLLTTLAPRQDVHVFPRPAPLHRAGALLPPTVPRLPNPQPGLGQAQPVTQVQSQAQAQTSVQSQAGMAVNEQRQAQVAVATQEAATPETNVRPAGSRGSWSAVRAAAAAAVLGLALVWRVPVAPVPACIARRRRRGRP